MKHRRRYSDAEKAYALAVLDENAGNESQTARDVNIPVSTLRRFVEGETHALTLLHQDKKLELADIYEQLQRKILPAAEAKIPDTGFRELMTGAGIAADKMAMLRGQQPAREGKVNIFVQMNQNVKDFPLK